MSVPIVEVYPYELQPVNQEKKSANQKPEFNSYTISEK